jgi:predicted alpha-1,2-mannosidase
MKHGYFPTDLTKAESVSSTLESVYDDYAAADMAKRMGKTEDAEYFGKRADFYKNLFDKETQFMRPRNSDGSWKSPFNPSQVAHAESNGGDYTEGNAWQYTWHVQHDVPGLIELFGGNEPFLNKLDSVFTIELETTQADVTGLIGQYAHGNEPSHHVTYLYALAGRPERTQELVRQIFDTQYRPEPDGLCGNDDCGQMSAWYMFSAMGFYPVDPVSGNYVFGAPQLPEITLHLADGKTFTVIAEGLSSDNKYVESITLNGEPYTLNHITHEDILKGGTLTFKMKASK